MPAKDLSQSAGILFDERRDFYLSDKMTKELWKDVSPFVTFMSQLGYDKCTDPDFKMFEHRAGFIKQRLFVAALGTGAWGSNGEPGDTVTVTLDPSLTDGLGDTVNDHILNMVFEVYNAGVYGGVVRAQSRTGNDVTFISQGNPNAANNQVAVIGNDAELELIGTAIGEGETSPEAFSDELEVVYNSTQIMRTPVEITGTLYETALRGYSKELERLRIQKSFEHKMQKENTFLKGVRVGGTGMGAGDNFSAIQTNANGNKVRQTMGAIAALRKYGVSDAAADNQNLFSFAQATADYADFVTASEKLSQYLPMRGRFSAFASRQWISFMSTKFLENTSSAGITIYNNEKSQFGYKVMLVVTPHCEIEFIATPALRRRYSNTAVIINPDAAGLMKFRDMKYSTNIKTENGYDGIKDEYFSDEGVLLQLIETHQLWTLT